MIEELKLAKPDLMKENSFTFMAGDNWLLKILPNGSILFNEELKLTAGQFANEFIRIVEENTSFRKDK